jgi:UDP-glucose 4-epimerase
MKRIVVTGVGGFIARKVAEKLVNLGNIVVGVDDFSSGYRDSLEFLHELLTIDLSDKTALKELPLKCDYILHLAGQSSGEISFDDPVKDLEKNTIATLNIIQYGISVQAKRIIYASSMSVYGSVDDRAISEIEYCQPVSCYGVGKLASENYLRIYQNQIPFTIYRMFNVYARVKT